MNFFEKLNLKPIHIAKIVGISILALVIFALFLGVLGTSFRSFFPRLDSSVQQTAKYGGNIVYEDSVVGNTGFVGEVASDLSVRNIVPTTMPTDGGVVPGDDAEEFEVKDYTINIETRLLDDTCNVVADLKDRDDIIFENSSKSDKNCYYRFKVRNASAQGVLVLLQQLDPKDINESVYTIKNIVEDYTSEVDILEKKLVSIDETLNNAVNAYDTISALATTTQDVESLSKIIDSKIRIIERLTQEKININAQLDRLNRSKAEQLDRLDYTYFSVRIAENKYIDSENIKDSWRVAIKSFVRDINKIIQDLSVNLVTLLFLIVQYIIYLFILLVVVKYCIRFGKYIWKK